eukprot:jgi/Psemu1/247164/estExt_Genewise1.C_9700011
MLADGLQGTHLYVLYEGYGFNVASLYALGFVAGAVTTPITGPLIDRFGRKRSAMLYCVLEMGINLLEQYPLLAGLLVSRMVGGITTNLLSSVFETWLDTEFRNRHEDEDTIAKNEYEVIMRDAVVVSNLASIASGYLAHVLAERCGPVGPFKGAVSCTGMALIAISLLWKENYGESASSFGEEEDGEEVEAKDDVEAISIFRSDPKILFLGIIQGLSAGSLQLFVFLWSPTLRSFSPGDSSNFVTNSGEGKRVISSLFRWAGRTVLYLLGSEFLLGISYIFASALMFIPSVLQTSSPESFSIALAAFLIYEFLVGITVTCEGLARSLYLPSGGRATMMMVPRMIVNLAVSLGVLLTKYIPTQSTFVAVAFLMSCSGVLQLSFLSPQEWNVIGQKLIRQIRRPSSCTGKFLLQLFNCKEDNSKSAKPKQN